MPGAAETPFKAPNTPIAPVPIPPVRIPNVVNPNQGGAGGGNEPLRQSPVRPTQPPVKRG